MSNQEHSEAHGFRGLFSYNSFVALYQQAIDLIFPPRCQHCGRVDTNFCTECTANLIAEPTKTISFDIQPLEGIISSGHHTGILQSSVQALKYNGQKQLGENHAQRLQTILNNTAWEVDMLIPVPLHTARLQKRGYNQAKEISKHLAILCNYNHDDTILARHTQTRSQVGLSRLERMENVKEAFIVTSSKLNGKNILLVDDVTTTGATLAACAEVLLANGAKSVYGITVTSA